MRKRTSEVQPYGLSKPHEPIKSDRIVGEVRTLDGSDAERVIIKLQAS
jgi:hypothetical protein